MRCSPGQGKKTCVSLLPKWQALSKKPNAALSFASAALMTVIEGRLTVLQRINLSAEEERMERESLVCDATPPIPAPRLRAYEPMTIFHNLHDSAGRQAVLSGLLFRLSLS